MTVYHLYSTATGEYLGSGIDPYEGHPDIVYGDAPTPEHERLAMVEAKVEAAAALAEQANATAQDVAVAMRDGRPAARTR